MHSELARDLGITLHKKASLTLILSKAHLVEKCDKIGEKSKSGGVW